jgi:hypothetical protein
MQVTKFHTEPETKIESGVRLNPIRDLVINEHTKNTCHPAAKNKKRKRRKS